MEAANGSGQSIFLPFPGKGPDMLACPHMLACPKGLFHGGYHPEIAGAGRVLSLGIRV